VFRLGTFGSVSQRQQAAGGQPGGIALGWRERDGERTPTCFLQTINPHTGLGSGGKAQPAFGAVWLWEWRLKHLK